MNSSNDDQLVDPSDAAIAAALTGHFHHLAAQHTPVGDWSWMRSHLTNPGPRAVARWRTPVLAASVAAAVIIGAGVALHSTNSSPASDQLTAAAAGLPTSTHHSVVATSAPTTRSVTASISNPGLTTASHAQTPVAAPQNILVEATTGQDSAGKPAAAVMVVHLATNRPGVSVLSIPLDTVVSALPCAGAASEPTVDAATAAGPGCVTSAVQILTGFRMDSFIQIDASNFQRVVDALGGVQVSMCGPVTDTKLGPIIEHSGPQVINGDLAAKLATADHVQGDTHPAAARTKRQQGLATAIIGQILAAKVLHNPTKVRDLLTALTTHSASGKLDVTTLTQIVTSLTGLTPDQVGFYTLPTTAQTAGTAHLQPESAKTLLNAITAGNPPMAHDTGCI